MSKPPKATPHSDIDGVHEDEARNTDVAAALGQDSGDVKRAKDESIARPQTSKVDSRDDRSR